MLWFGKKKSPRRVESRRAAPSEVSLRQRFGRAGGLGALLVAAGFYAAVMLLDSWPLEPLPYRQGQYLDQDVYARVEFQSPSPVKTLQKREEAVKLTPVVFAPDEPALQNIVSDLKSLPGKLKSASQPAQLPDTLRKAFNIVTVEDLAAFAQYANPDKADEFSKQIDALRANLGGQAKGDKQRRYIVTGKDYSSANYSKDTEQIRVELPGGGALEPRSRLLSLDARDLEPTLAMAVAAAEIDPALQVRVVKYLNDTIAAGVPLFRVNEKATKEAEDLAAKAVGPVVETSPAGTKIAERTTLAGLADRDITRLAKEQAAYIEQQNDAQPWRKPALLLGRMGMIGAVIGLLCLYIVKYQPNVARRPQRGLSVAALLLVVLLGARIAIGQMHLNPYLTVAGIFLAAVVLTIAYDQRFAFAITGALVVLITLQMRLSLGPLTVFWAAAAAAIFQLHEIRTRSKLIETGGVTALVVLAAVWAVESATGMPARFTLVDSCVAAGSAIAGGFVAQGLLPLVERVFGIATALTLLEWCDANKPLLKRLALEAPGTYTHSLMLGTMCEAAAETVGARGLLARVGAYYHDIGKINKPEYFTENQAGPVSKHARLSPAISLIIIKSHVKDGLQLAEEYGLPWELRQFIVTHHGSTLVEYFYHLATQLRLGAGQTPPEEIEFRYHGPKPATKEAAILMLADASESSVRALSDPSSGRIETQVHAVVTKRLTDGQLDECDLTLREVHAIETSMVKSLAGIFHGRIRYPSQHQDTPPAGGTGESSAAKVG
jgi:putative nucleotidyltransferase with HDIG domain